ncbi:protein-glutamine gamma-glutamyltransferase [Paenibacillus nasutitermitis]|uniref:Protein-glutamine gamma-glutamyltransferase n=1 Tax=Paenibacillus nasutitermitis TaxID=1652958 RepID=A0A917DR42_9BACL|nr:protein-glutamine gamma-glutamyltransferase [Paenibacillus nasutitermitis]GGD58501.1 protein-glutamine gamma-glutamyltransferase [Paenibacillus nasutitermitis]
MITISGVQTPVDTTSWSPVANKIYQLKRNTTIIYNYESVGQLRFEMELRASIVAAAEALSTSGLRFASFKKAQCNERFWHLTEQGGFRIRDDTTPAAGIRDMFNDGGKYATECSTATMAVIYKGVLDSLRESDFNLLFAGLLLYDWHPDDHLQLNTQAGINDIYPGDILYFKNPDFSPETPEWRGENVIVIEDGLYYGHPFGIVPAQTIIDGLNRNRISGSSRSAYLMDQVTRPDYVYLSQFAPDVRSVIFARIGELHYVY